MEKKPLTRKDAKLLYATLVMLDQRGDEWFESVKQEDDWSRLVDKAQSALAKLYYTLDPAKTIEQDYKEFVRSVK